MTHFTAFAAVAACRFASEDASEPMHDGAHSDAVCDGVQLDMLRDHAEPVPARKPTRKTGRRRASVRHDDSAARSLLPSTTESASDGGMTRPATELPTDLDALRALIAAERAAHATVIAERQRLASRNGEFEASVVALTAAVGELTAAKIELASCNGTLSAENSELVTSVSELAVRNTQLEETKAQLEASKTELEARKAELEQANARLEALLAEIRRAHFGRKSERISEDQLRLALEDLETAVAKVEAEVAKAKPASERPRRQRQTTDGSLDHLPHEEIVIEPDGGTICACCNGTLHKAGEDRTKRLDRQPAKVRVIVEVRPKYGCRTCEQTGADEVAGIIQAPAPAHLIEGGLPTEALVADVVVSKFADHLPLYRQSQILARQGVKIDRSTLAGWVGAAAAEIQPLHDHLLAELKASPKLFCDETRCPVLEPGNGRTKTGYMWAIARDDRPWGAVTPPAVLYSYAPGRGAEHAEKLLEGFTGILQTDGYKVYKGVARRSAARLGETSAGEELRAITLAFCWSHTRRKFYELHIGGQSPIATEALARIAKLYAVEAEVRGLSPEARHAARQARAKPVVEALKPWLEASLAKVPSGGRIAEAIRYALNHWDGLVRYLADGRIEIDTNIVERSIRGLVLTRKNALFAGHDEGARSWAMLASLLETAKLNAVDPLAWLTDVLVKLVNLWPASRIGELMPWAWAAARAKPVVATAT